MASAGPDVRPVKGCWMHLAGHKELPRELPEEALPKENKIKGKLRIQGDGDTEQGREFWTWLEAPNTW